MGSERYDLEAESTRVRYELVTFRDACLPALLGGAGRRQDVSHLQWWTATERLIVALPRKCHVGRFQPEWFDCLHEEPEPGYEIRDGQHRVAVQGRALPHEADRRRVPCQAIRGK